MTKPQPDHPFGGMVLPRFRIEEMPRQEKAGLTAVLRLR